MCVAIPILPLYMQECLPGSGGLSKQAIQQLHCRVCCRLSDFLCNWYLTMCLLLILHDVTCTCRSACLEVESQQLCCLSSGQPTTLQAFQEQHTARLAAAQTHLLAVAAQVVAAAKAACEASLAGLEQQLMGGAHAAADAAGTAR
jgi:hypothetical protein